MGCCCSSETVPVYDDEPPTRFDVVVDDYDDVACKPPPLKRSAHKRHSRHGSTGAANAETHSNRPVSPTESTCVSMYSPAESVRGDGDNDSRDFQIYDMMNQTATQDPRRDISSTAVNSFVQSVNRGLVDETFLQMTVTDDMLAAEGMDGDVAGSNSSFRGGYTGGMTVIQYSYIEAADTLEEKVKRLGQVETERRLEIEKALKLSTKMMEFAKKRVMPTFRTVAGPGGVAGGGVTPQRNSISRRTHSKQPSTSTFAASPVAQQAPNFHVDPSSSVLRPRRPCVVIHHKDLDVADDGFCSPARATAAGNNDNEEYASLRGEREEPPSATAGDSPHTAGTGASPLLADMHKGGSHHQYESVLQSDSFARVPSEAGSQLATGHLEQLEMLELTAMDIPQGHQTKCAYADEMWDFLSMPGAQTQLNNGDGYFRFKCCALHKADDTDLHLMRMFANVSVFENEERENNVPIVDFDSQEDLEKYTCVWVKAMYMFPGVKIDNVSASLLCTPDYQRNCQPGKPKVFDDVPEPMTFRSIKVAIKFIFSLTVQMRCSEITDPAVLQTFKSMDGIVPTKILVMERTKRDITKKDSTAKCKSFLIYYPITGGLLVTHMTVVLNTAIPKVAGPVVSTFAKSGTVEAAETCTLTRAYLIKHFGDSRDDM